MPIFFQLRTTLIFRVFHYQRLVRILNLWYIMKGLVAAERHWIHDVFLSSDSRIPGFSFPNWIQSILENQWAVLGPVWKFAILDPMFRLPLVRIFKSSVLECRQTPTSPRFDVISCQLSFPSPWMACSWAPPHCTICSRVNKEEEEHWEINCQTASSRKISLARTPLVATLSQNRLPFPTIVWGISRATYQWFNCTYTSWSTG